MISSCNNNSVKKPTSCSKKRISLSLPQCFKTVIFGCLEFYYTPEYQYASIYLMFTGVAHEDQTDDREVPC